MGNMASEMPFICRSSCPNGTCRTAGTLIQQAIDTLIQGRTSIVIAHRLSTIRKAHNILVLNNGSIQESGTHEALMAQEGYYAQLYRMQFQTANTTTLV